MLKLDYICWSKDKQNLARSASGGIMYELAKYFIDKHGYVVGVNHEGKWDIAQDLSIVQTFQGSKYWRPEGLNTVLKLLTRITRPVMFVGTPCQVMRVSRMFHMKDNIFYVCLQCHGYYKKKGLIREGVDKAQHGWNRSWYNLPKDYLDNSGLENSCKKCKLEPDGDLVISDAWGCPKWQMNEYGTSRVKTITEKGYDVFHACENITWQYEGTVQIRPRRIALLDVHDYTNLGNQLLAVNFINKVHQIDPSIEFVFLEERCTNAERYIGPQTNAKVIYRTINLTKDPMKTIVKDGIGLENIEDCESIVVLGGDCFSANSWHWKWIRYFLFFYLAQRENKKLFFVSNTIGNFPIYIKAFGKRILKRFTHIYARDKWTAIQLLNLGVKDNVSYMPDLVYTRMPDCKVTLPHENYVVISPSLLIDKYANSREEYLDLCRQIIKFLREYTNLPVMVMPHSSDLFARKLAMDIGDGYCVFPHNASEARAVLTKSKFNVCFRMHSALQGLQAGTPCAAIGYSEKYTNQLPSAMLALPKINSIKEVIKQCYHTVYNIEAGNKQALINKRMIALVKKINATTC